MISSILWPHLPANHIDGKNPAAYSSVLSRSWPQNQISHVGGWAKGMSWQIPTEVDSCPSPSPFPLKSLKKGQLGAVSFKEPLNSIKGERRAMSAIQPWWETVREACAQPPHGLLLQAFALNGCLWTRTELLNPLKQGWAKTPVALA